MARPNPKCKGCGLDVTPEDKDPDLGCATKHSGRWWHNNCWDNRPAGYSKKAPTMASAFDTPDTRQQIHNYMRQLNPIQYNPIKINSQLKSLVQHGINEDLILLSLKYWYKEMRRSTEEANGGIGIVQYVYQDAQKYYAKKELHKKMNEYFQKCKEDTEHVYKLPERRPQQTKGKRKRPVNTRWIDMK